MCSRGCDVFCRRQHLQQENWWWKGYVKKTLYNQTLDHCTDLCNNTKWQHHYWPMNWNQHWMKTNKTGNFNSMFPMKLQYRIQCPQGQSELPTIRNPQMRTWEQPLAEQLHGSIIFFLKREQNCVSQTQVEKKVFKDEKHSPRAAASPVSPAAPQSTWRWLGLSGTCPDSLWQAPPAGVEWIRAHRQPGAEQCLGNTLQWCQAADPPSGLSPGKQPRWKT